MAASMAFVDALRALNTMKAEGVVEEYAIAGAMALVFWTEPVSTYDLDVLVFLPSGAGPLVSLDGIYRWASSRGYATHKEHVVIEGVPTQFLPSPGNLGDEAIETAQTLEYEGVPARVVLPEYAMVSRSEDASTLGQRTRPSAELLARLRQGKAELRREREGLSLREKVIQVMELQRVQYPLLARRRPLEPWERPWEIEP
jgi:hypothetical protein